MEPLVGTRQCPHLGFEVREGRPCCHADDGTREACGRWAPNPRARAGGSSAGVEPFFCTVLGKDAVPAEALKLAARAKAAAARGARASRPGYQPPGQVTGRSEPKPPREGDPEQPVIPTYTIRREERRPGPNERCPCGSGRKYKKCCGRGG
jgi:hypothetical protein